MEKGHQTDQQSSSVTPIVALCASAGGLEAFQEFFDVMPGNTGMAFVVVQHLASQQESILPQLIRRHTSIPVHDITDDMLVKKNNVYVLPAGHELRISEGQLQLTQREQLDGWPRTIDTFLKSLADDRGTQVAVIILSGAGSDGAEGSRLIKANGGLIIGQELDSATQTSMPASVIKTGLAHYALPIKQMPDVLQHHFETQQTDIQMTEELASAVPDFDISRIIRYLQRQTGHNFSDYKESTMQRQISRRIAAHQLHSVEDYLDYMNNNPQEAEELLKQLLINVTGFFRDPEAFQSFKTNALLPTISRLDENTVFRGWIAGCATGEEAISTAIVIDECLQELDMPNMEVRLFATDINSHAIQHARKGVYPPAIADQISPERLEKHFFQDNDGYRPRNHIRRMIVWSEHNLIDHPPFSHLHLISCRNVMIYFQPQLQNRVMGLFAFALKTDGILFLGTSETPDTALNTFKAIDSKSKIYRRVGDNGNFWQQFNQPLFRDIPNRTEAQMPIDNQHRGNFDDAELTVIKNKLVDHYHATCAVVDEHYRVRYTYGDIDRYLRIVPGKDGQHSILDMAREGLDLELTIALHEAFETNEDSIRQGVWVKSNGDERIINLIVKAIEDIGQQGWEKLIIFDLTVSADKIEEARQGEYDDKDGETIRRLREDLEQTQKAFQSVTQALQAKSEELMSSMEEIQSANEEIQTTNEELRTSKEELESMNEELNTLNTQLTDQNDELTQANNTLHNFMQSTEIGMIFLDQDLDIREFTSAVTNIFGLRRGDMGRPLAEVAYYFSYDNLIADATSILDTLNNVEKEVTSTDGHWYKILIRPYRTIDNIIDGLVLTFTDITSQKLAQIAAEQQTDYVKQIFDTIDDNLLELDTDLRILAANQSFYDAFEVKVEETVGQLLQDLGNKQWDIPELHRLLTEIVPEQTIVRDYTVTHDFPALGMRSMRLNARQIAGLDRILLVITDITHADETD